MPGVDIEQASSRPQARRNSVLSSKSYRTQARLSEEMEDRNGLRVTGKKRKRDKQRIAHNCPQNCTVPTLGAHSDGGKWSGDRNPFLIADLPLADVDVSVGSMFHRSPVGGATLLSDKQKGKKKILRPESEQNYQPESFELALIAGASIEREKESLRAWVEMDLKRQADCATLQSEQDGLALGRESVFAGHAFVHRNDATVEKSFGRQEDRAFDRAFANGIDRVGDNSNRIERKPEADRVLQYVTKRSVVLRHSPSTPLSTRLRTIRTDVIAWGKCIAVTVTSEASTVQEWVWGQSGCLFGLDVEWKPNRVRGVENKSALLQLCSENECLIIQLLFLDSKPEALRELLFNPLTRLAGVGVHSDFKRLFKDHGLLCQGEVELTILASERLKREELKNVGLKALASEVLGLNMKKQKKITLSDWSRRNLDLAQVEYACIDAWVSFALAQKLMTDTLEGQ